MRAFDFPFSCSAPPGLRKDPAKCSRRAGADCWEKSRLSRVRAGARGLARTFGATRHCVKGKARAPVASRRLQDERVSDSAECTEPASAGSHERRAFPLAPPRQRGESLLPGKGRVRRGARMTESFARSLDITSVLREMRRVARENGEQLHRLAEQRDAAARRSMIVSSRRRRRRSSSWRS